MAPADGRMHLTLKLVHLSHNLDYLRPNIVDPSPNHVHLSPNLVLQITCWHVEVTLIDSQAAQILHSKTRWFYLKDSLVLSIRPLELIFLSERLMICNDVGLFNSFL